MRQLYFLVFCFFGELFASSLGASSQFIELIQTEAFRAAGQLLRDKESNGMRLNDLKALSDSAKFQPLAQTVADYAWFISEKRKLGIDKKHFLEMAFFIHTEMPKYLKEHGNYLSKEKTALQYAVEYDPETGHAYLLLDGSVAFLGRGGKKSVYKAILVNGRQSKVVARGEQWQPMDKELSMYKRLKKLPGIIETHAITTRKENERTYTALYSELYNPGSLNRDVFKNYTFTLKEKAKIMSDLLAGLEAIHAQNVVHRDLHAQNYFINIKNRGKNRHVEAVIADFGRALPLEEAKNIVVQGSVKCIAPEGWVVEKMNGKDYFATDIYAMGCVFYKIFHEKMPSWIAKEYFKDKTVPREEKAKFLKTQLKKAAQKRHAELQKKKRKSKLSSKEDLEFLILQMVHLDPAKRGSAKALREESQRILKSVKRKI